jgi:hypothetical protein
MTKLHLTPPVQKSSARNGWSRIAALAVVVSIGAAIALMASVAVGVAIMQ